VIFISKTRIREGCQTEIECEDAYLEDNPHIGTVSLIFSANLGIKFIAADEISRSPHQGWTDRITTEDLTGSVVVEDKENARFRDVILLYAGALFATGMALGADGIIEFTRLALHLHRSGRIPHRHGLAGTSG
jgi:hypothetical protein